MKPKRCKDPTGTADFYLGDNDNLIDGELYGNIAPTSNINVYIVT